MRSWIDDVNLVFLVLCNIKSCLFYSPIAVWRCVLLHWGSDYSYLLSTQVPLSPSTPPEENLQLMPFPPARSALPRCAGKATLHSRHSYLLHYHLPSILVPFHPRLASTRRRAQLLATGSVGFQELTRGFLCYPHRLSSSTSTAMAATKIDGTQIAKSIRAQLKDEIQQIQQANPRFKPSLVIFQGV